MIDEMFLSHAIVLTLRLKFHFWVNALCNLAYLCKISHYYGTLASNQVIFVLRF